LRETKYSDPMQGSSPNDIIVPFPARSHRQP
jgi:hypothetical protein